MSVPTCVYRQRDASGRCLYIGLSCDPAVRLASHTGASSWVTHVRTIDVEWFPSRELAMMAEAAAIRAENPPFNIVGTTRPRGVPRCQAPALLDQWLIRTGTTADELAPRVRSTPLFVQRMARGQVRARPMLAQRVEAATNGAVPASSWVSEIPTEPRRIQDPLRWAAE